MEIEYKHKCVCYVKELVNIESFRQWTDKGIWNTKYFPSSCQVPQGLFF